MAFLKEFKEFAVKGNLVDLSVAFVMGAAFGKVVSGFIDGIVMPVVGKIVSGVDFKSHKYVLTQAKLDPAGKIIEPETAIRYGEFITTLIDFTLVAFFMFLLVKAINKIRRKREEVAAAAPAPTYDQQLLAEIRDLLKSKP